MRKALLSAVVAAQFLVPTGILALEIPVLSEIFVRDERPEWSADHVRKTEAWESHETYHKRMEEQLKDFEDRWTMRKGATEYKLAKRALLTSMQREHRMIHAHLLELEMENQKPLSEDRSIVTTGRKAVFTPLPRRSHRLIELEVNMRERKI